LRMILASPFFGIRTIGSGVAVMIRPDAERTIFHTTVRETTLAADLVSKPFKRARE